MIPHSLNRMTPSDRHWVRADALHSEPVIPQPSPELRDQALPHDHPELLAATEPAAELDCYPNPEGVLTIGQRSPKGRAFRRRYRMLLRAAVIAPAIAVIVMAAGIAVRERQHAVRLADAEARAAAVYIPFRNQWLCRRFQRHEGAWLCIEPRKQS